MMNFRDCIVAPDHQPRVCIARFCSIRTVRSQTPDPCHVKYVNARQLRRLGLLAVGMLLLALSGCGGPALNPDMRNTFLDSHDLVVMTDKMAAAMASDPIMTQLAERGPMTIVLTPLKNKTDQIIPRRQGDIFLHRLRALLTAHESLRRKFIFVLNKATYQRLAAREQTETVSLGPDAGRLQPHYALQATFYSDNKVSPEYRSAYYLCTFFLTNIHTGEIIWEGSYETKKAVHSGLLD